MSNIDLDELKEQVIALMGGDESKAEEWLNTSSSILDNKTPLEYSKTEKDLREVLTLINRIRHGVFS